MYLNLRLWLYEGLFSATENRLETFWVHLPPLAEVVVYGKNKKPRAITMLVDTGADFIILPRREAAILGIDLSQDCTVHTTYGVGGPQQTYLYKGLEVELGETRLEIPVGFLDRNNVSPLLGRHQFMELFATCLDDKVVSFEEL